MTLRSITYDFKANFAQFKAGLASAGSAVSEFGAKLQAEQKSAESLTEKLEEISDLGAKIGATAGTGFALAVSASANFEKSLSAVRAATGESVEGMERLREAALQAGADTVFSASESSGAIEELAKAGISTADILGGGLAGALDLAAAGGLEVADAAEAAASAMTQFGLSGEDVPHIADLLAAGAGKAQGSVEDMSAALNQSGLVAAQTGLTIEETTGALSAFASAGLTGSDAGTSFKTMLQALTPSSKEAAKLMKDLGISAYDSQGNFVGLTKFADSLRAGLEDLSVEQQNAALKTIFGSDAVRAAAVIYDQGAKGIQSWITKTNDAGYAAEQAAMRTDNLKGDIEELSGAIETLLIGTGEGQQGFLRDATQSTTDFVNVLNDMPSSVKSTTGALLGLTAVTGAAMFFGPKVIMGIAATRAQLALLPAAAAKARIAMASMVMTGPGLAKTATLVGGIGLAASGASDKLNITNTTLGAMAGLMLGGPWGAAVGGGIGALLDFKSAAGDAATSQETFNAALASADSKKLRDEIKATMADIESLRDAQDFGGDGFTDGLHDLITAPFIDRHGESTNLEAIRVLNGRKSALEAAARAADEAAVADSEYGAELAKLPELAHKSATEILEMSDALVKSREAADESASSFLGLGESLNDPKTSLSDWIKELEDSAIALREFRKNSEEAGRKGLDEGLIASLQAAGEEGATRMAELADASDEEITRANRAFRRGERQLDLYVDAFGGVPEVVATDVRLTGLEDAKTALSIFAKSITSNPIVQHVVVVGPDGKKVKGQVGTDSSLEGLLGVPGAATGTTVPKGGAYRDRYPYLLAPGEEVIADDMGQASRNRPLLKAISSGVDPALAFAQSRSAYSGSMGGGSVGTVKLSRDDLDYIAGSLAQARPLYGAVNMQPHNYSEFTRQMDADSRRTALGGIPS